MRLVFRLDTVVGTVPLKVISLTEPPLARLVELVDTAALGAVAERRGGSSPSVGTIVAIV